MEALSPQREQPARSLTLFLCVDVMIGQGIDQILRFDQATDEGLKPVWTGVRKSGVR